MSRYVAFLRGMNLGKRRIKNEELRAHFEAMGFEEVATFRASGNVIFATPKREARASWRSGSKRSWMSARLRRAGLPAQRSRRSRRSPRSSRSRLKAIKKSKGKLQVSLLEKKPSAAAKKKALALATDEDLLAIEARELYWLPSGGLPSPTST